MRAFYSFSTFPVSMRSVCGENAPHALDRKCRHRTIAVLDTVPLLRAMTIDDVDRVAILEGAAFDHGWSPTAFRRELTTNGAARYLVLEDTENGIVAFGGLWLMFDEAHVVTVAVEIGLRRKGYGRIVVDGLVRLAQALGMANATLECRVSNEAARALYRDYGFYEVGARKAYYADNNEDAVIMTTEPFSNEAYQDRLSRLKAKLAPFACAVAAIS